MLGGSLFRPVKPGGGYVGTVAPVNPGGGYAER
jgi:hypothetical protein